MSRLALSILRTAAVAAALGLCVVPAAAEDREGAQRYELRWVREGGAESCVSGAALTRLLEATLGDGAVPAERVLLEGRVAPASAPLRYQARVVVRDAQTGELIGERELSTSEPSCAALTPSLLLVMAMSVDPDRAQSGLPQAVTDELERGLQEDVDVWPVAPPVVAKSLDPHVVPPPRPEPDRPTAHEAPQRRLQLAAGVAISREIQPNWAPGVALRGRFQLGPRWSLSLTALGWLPTEVEPQRSYYLLDGGVRFYSAGFVPAICRRIVGDRLSVDGCAGAHLGLRWVHAAALQKQSNPVRAFLAPSLELQSSFKISSTWLVHAAVALDAELDGQRYMYRDHAGRSQLLFEPGLLLPRGLIGVGAAL